MHVKNNNILIKFRLYFTNSTQQILQLLETIIISVYGIQHDRSIIRKLYNEIGRAIVFVPKTEINVSEIAFRFVLLIICWDAVEARQISLFNFFFLSFIFNVIVILLLFIFFFCCPYCIVNFYLFLSFILCIYLKSNICTFHFDDSKM